MKVPTYEQQVKSKDSVEFGSAVKTAVENFGGGRANIADAAEPGLRLFAEQKKKADDMRVAEAEMRLTELETKLLYDRDFGALNKKGKNAFGAYEETSAEYDKGVAEIENELSNNSQKSSFAAAAYRKKLSIDRSLQNHIGQETVRYDLESTTAAVKMEGIAAQEAFKDPVRVQEAVQKQIQYIEQFGERNGMSPEEIAVKKSEVVSGTHEDVINRMLSNDYELGAQEYLKSVKDAGQLSGDALTRVEKAVEAGSNRKSAQMSVDQYMSKGLSESAAYKEASKIEDSKLREETENRINLAYSRREAARKDGLEKAQIKILNDIDKGIDPTKSQLWPVLDENQRSSLLSYQARKAQGNEVVTDRQLYMDLKLMAGNPETRNDFVKVDLYAKGLTKLSKKDFEEIKGIQDDLRGGKTGGADGFGTKNQIFNETMKTLKVTNEKKKADYFLKVNQVEDNLRRINGKDLTPTEFQQELDKLMVQEISVGGSVTSQGPVLNAVLNLFKGKQRVIDLTPEQIKTIKYSDIPKGEIVEIERVLKAKGRAVTNDAIQRIYQDYLNNVLAKGD